MGQLNYSINEFGEIVNEDYFVTSVKTDITGAQMLPTNRKAWKMWLLNLVTLGIYGTVITYAMAKETNVSCAEDGRHTRNFWGTLLLAIITLGIYGLVWNYKWANREYAYLCRHRKEGGILNGGGFLCMGVVSLVLNFAGQYVAGVAESMEVWGIFYLLSLLWGYIVTSVYIKQHNAVNKIYNLDTFVEQPTKSVM